MNKQIVVIAHNIRSAHNVGALLRTCDGLGIDQVILSGYTPYPKKDGDSRLPHLAEKTHARIKKTALGAEESVDIAVVQDLQSKISGLKTEGFVVIGLEQSPNSSPLNDFRSQSSKIALLLGEEVDGIDSDIIKLCDQVLEIPMLGKKESHNVVQAAAMALYHLKLIDT